MYVLLEGSVYLLINYHEKWELETGVSEVSEAWAFLRILKASLLVVCISVLAESGTAAVSL